MFPITQSNTQVYSVFGSFVVEQHEAEHLQRHIDRLPRADVAYGPKDVDFWPRSQRNRTLIANTSTSGLI